MSRIGVLGGSFDPIHDGHIRIAELAKRAASLESVLFMPVNIQPFKQEIMMAPPEDRYAMAEIALCHTEDFMACDTEISVPGVSYTIDSLRKLRELYCAGERGIHFIIGTDMFLNIEKWKEYENLMTEFDFIVGRRPGYKDGETDAAAARYRAEFDTEITMIDGPFLDISSTEIRRKVTAGEDIRAYTDDKVVEYIAQYGFYRAEEKV